MKQAAQWTWGAGGKHPVVKDYIMLGQETQVMRAMSRWMEEGYARLGEREVQHSWRFFTRGLKPEELACGLLRDSRDKAGRPFPLIIMGYGRMDGWDKKWELLPYAFDDVWERMEFLSIKRFFDLEELKGDISRLPLPVINGMTQGEEAPALIPAGLSSGTDIVSQELKGEGDHREKVSGLLRAIKAGHPAAPAAVFIGGTKDRDVLMAFMKSLGTADFEKLWTTE